LSQDKINSDLTFIQAEASQPIIEIKLQEFDLPYFQKHL
jgi:hypothetical protein